MEVILVRDAAEGALTAARYFKSQIQKKPTSVLGLATGSTPIPLYRELIRMHREENLCFSGVTTFNLDEYFGIAPDHPGSYRFFMKQHLFDHVNLHPKHVHLPDGQTQNVESHCAEYEALIKKGGGIDLQVLGIGHDGHIGFNEPSSSLASRTRIKTLTQTTVNANQQFFRPGEQVPRHVLTMGIGTILDSRQCLLLAFGKAKASAIALAVEGPLTAKCPASALQLHPKTTAIIDHDAASLLALREYYREVQTNKPEWQRV